MIAVMILEDHDQIVGTDFVRQATPINESAPELTWARAESFCPDFVGKTVGQFHNVGVGRHARFEFIHGKIPLAHQTIQTSDTLR